MNNVVNIATRQTMEPEEQRHPYEAAWANALGALDALAALALEDKGFSQRGYRDGAERTISPQSMLRTLERNLSVIRSRIAPVTTSSDKGGVTIEQGRS